jgi:hypothetical protein
MVASGSHSPDFQASASRACTSRLGLVCTRTNEALQVSTCSASTATDIHVGPNWRALSVEYVSAAESFA